MTILSDNAKKVTPILTAISVHFFFFLVNSLDRMALKRDVQILLVHVE